MNFFFQDQGVHKIAKKTCGTFFSIFDVFTSIKELFYKPSEIQLNIYITGTLPGKLKRKIYWALSYTILPPEITKMREIAILGVLWGSGNQSIILWFL